MSTDFVSVDMASPQNPSNVRALGYAIAPGNLTKFAVQPLMVDSARPAPGDPTMLKLSGDVDEEGCQEIPQ